MTSPAERLATLQRFLVSDPSNAALAAECIETALIAGEADTAADLLLRTPDLDAQAQGRIGLAAMRAQRFDIARDMFAPLQAGTPTDPNLCFNLAWCCAMLQEKPRALALLDEACITTLPQAAMLKVQLIHDAGDHDEAAALAARLVELHPTHPGLLAAASVLAVDNENLVLAAEYATRAGEHPDALTSLGIVALSEDKGAEAQALFARALALNTHGPRAWIGTGLVKMLNGDHAGAAADISHGAQIFGEHLGSWIGAGWAALMADDKAAARAAFDRAMALDQTFSEAHGSLAVLDLLEGDATRARRGAETALRLDPQCFSGALARALLASSEGRPDAAQAIIRRALNTPIDQNGRTVAQSLARLGLSA